ncbi:dethiobiotin synthase [Thalassotalea crassostreae]|uniref:dethiobiotin synthase n=1 Tax=Thalassotalea crassostreae TaxID=1763536 RepID=UPI0008381AB2|nr:dethiobiotin synthase [Thalassotalea crassostreae]
MKSFFITATDTDAGKTMIATALVSALSKKHKVCVFKPVSAGCTDIDGTLVNDDAAQLLAKSNGGQTIDQVNPIAFLPPIAPHIAAQQTNSTISISQIDDIFADIEKLKADYCIVEGAGGWRLPLGNGGYLSEFPRQRNMPVILVVGMKLGCLNHAVLSFESIVNDGLNVVGWIANAPEPMDYLDENIEYLRKNLDTCFLGVVGNVSSAEQAAIALNIDSL